MTQRLVCGCKRGYASQLDGKCCKCRTWREREAFEEMRAGYHKGFATAEQFPELTEIGNPYKREPRRSAWIQGMKDAHAARKAT